MTVVLIHSTGQSAAGWDLLVREVGARGTAAHAIDLPELLAADYAQFVAAAVPGAERPVVVAHSGSGPLLPALVESLDASRQVWPAAWVPEPQTSFPSSRRPSTTNASP